MLNALSIDVEDWFQVNNFNKIIKFKDWPKCESRIEININLVLKILDKQDTKATFFILGWIAEKYPELIKKISNNGHEIASHGYSHTKTTNVTKSQFENDLKKSLKILKKIINKKIIGYRAPSFSINKDTLWALDILKKYGIKYDSSIFPIINPQYGIPNFFRFPKKLNNGLIEFPLSTVKILNFNFPIAGGAYFRLFPHSIIKYGIKKLNKINKPAIFYIHPWEFDKEQPKINPGIFKKFIHYYNIKKNKKKFEKLLTDFHFAPIRDILGI